MSDSRASRARRLPPEQRRERLLRRGIELAEETPWSRLSCERLARGAGVSPGLLYRYFPSKHDFLAAVLAGIARRLEDAGAGADPFAAGPVAWLEGRVAFAEASPGLYRLLVARGSDPELGAPLVALRRRDVRRMLAAGHGADTPGGRARALAWLGACETALLHWLEDREPGRDALMRLLAAGLERGSGRSPTRPKPRLRLVPVVRPPAP